MQCRLYACGTKRELSHQHRFVHNPPDMNLASPPTSPGNGYWQNKSNSTQWELTPPECICMHIKSMQHSTQIMTTSDIINHHQPQHDISTYHEMNHPKA